MFKILVADPIAPEVGHHQSYNWGIVRALSSQCRVLYASNASLASFVSSRGGGDICYPIMRSIVRPARTVAMKLLNRQICLCNLVRLYRLARTERIPNILLTGFDAISLSLFLRLVRIIGDKSTAVHCVAHSNIQMAKSNRVQRIGLREVVTRAATTIALDQCQKAELLRLLALPGNYPRLRVVPHPLPDVSPVPVDRDYKIRWVGSVRSDKGIGILAEALRRVPPLIRSRVEIIGEASDDVDLTSLPDECRYGNVRLEFDQYEELLARSGFIVLAHTSDFRHRVSGQLFDALSVLTPAIYSRIPAFHSVFGEHGDCGIPFEPGDPQSLADALVRACSISPDEWAGMQNRLRALRARYSDSSIASQILSAMWGSSSASTADRFRVR